MIPQTPMYLLAAAIALTTFSTKSQALEAVSQDILDAAPVLDLNKTAFRTARPGIFTDYVDFIKSSDLPADQAIMQFNDRNRLGIAFRYRLEPITGPGSTGECDKSKINVSAIFQRYSKNDGTWVAAGHAGSDFFRNIVDPQGPIDKTLTELFNTGSSTFEYTYLNEKDNTSAEGTCRIILVPKKKIGTMKDKAELSKTEL